MLKVYVLVVTVLLIRVKYTFTLNYIAKYHMSYRNYKLVFIYGTATNLLVEMVGHATNPSGNTGRYL
jgi:hypothetical protein